MVIWLLYLKILLGKIEIYGFIKDNYFYVYIIYNSLRLKELLIKEIGMCYSIFIYCNTLKKWQEIGKADLKHMLNTNKKDEQH